METKKRRSFRLGLFLAVPLALTSAACTGKHNRTAVQNEEPQTNAPGTIAAPGDTAPVMVSTVRMNDAKAGGQLLNGFYPIEGGAWRWTARKFSVYLRTPAGAAQSGATLSFLFTIPDVVIQKLQNLTLTASSGGMVLKTAEYKAPGAEVFSADVPASLLGTDSIKVDFTLDKSLPPGVDKRELGIIATSVGITSK